MFFLLRKSLFIAVCFVVFFATGQAQINFGYPFLKNYQRFEYQGGLQSWEISQAANGLLYFANNDGLLEFDGHAWELYAMPDGSIIRSVYADSSGRIYVGGSNDFGFFRRTARGGMDYHSLFDSSKIDRSEFEEIWKIHKIDESIVFQSYKQLIFVTDSITEVVRAASMFHFSFVVNNQLYVVDTQQGVMRFAQGSPTLLPGTHQLTDTEVTSILPYNNSLLITTLDNGAFVHNGHTLHEWENATASFLKNNQIYRALRLNDTTIAFATVQNGLVVCSNEGDVLLHVNEAKGLQNNTILSLNTDRNGNLWLCTDNGIDVVKMNSPFRLINKYHGISAGYAAVVHGNMLYLGTNRGVFCKPLAALNAPSLKRDAFDLIEKTKGQVWTLQIVDNQLFCGHNNGTYIINGTEAQKISDIPGVWRFVQSDKHPDKAIAGTYNGLILFEKTNGQWAFSKQIEGFDESSRVMYLDGNENLWMSHVYKGVYHILLNDDFSEIREVKFYNKENGFKTNYGINVAQLNNEIVFLTSTGIYQYDKQSDKMVFSNEFNQLFGGRTPNFVYQTSRGDMWCIAHKQLFVLRQLEDGSFSEIQLPFNPLHGKFIDDFEFVYPLSEQNVLIGYENGFILYDGLFKKDYQQNFNMYISEIRLSDNDSTLFSGKIFEPAATEKPQLAYQHNGLHFFFSAVDFETPEKLKFSTFLQGYDKVWSDWENFYDREFTNLPEGDYAFYVKAQNVYGAETEPLVFRFTIQPPFYRTTVAYVVYGLLFILSVLLTVFLVLKRIEKVKQHEKHVQKQKYQERERELQREALIAEKEIVKLRNEKLRQEMKNKDKELAESTMRTIKKNEFLISLKKDLNKIATLTPSQDVKRSAKSTIRKINHDIDNEHNWKVFEQHFLDVHEQFISRIKKEYPDITPSELRLCACLRMNLSSKEIASLFNISVRGVETSRYRLRKTLNLDRKINLTDFILSF